MPVKEAVEAGANVFHSFKYGAALFSAGVALLLRDSSEESFVQRL